MVMDQTSVEEKLDVSSTFYWEYISAVLTIKLPSKSMLKTTRIKTNKKDYLKKFKWAVKWTKGKRT